MSNSRYHETTFKSEPMKIGKHEWRVIVYKSTRYGMCSDYEWRKSYGVNHSDERHPWKSMKSWPRYNFNDGCYGGCPKTLVKLYSINKAEVDRHLNGEKL